MSDFYDLRKPEQEPHGIHKDKWFVIAKKHPKGAALLNDGSGELELVKWPEEENSIFYFDTEREVYLAAISYYAKNNKSVPHFLLTGKTREISTNDSESQVMEFV